MSERERTWIGGTGNIPNHCQRCSEKTDILIMSIFNTQMICFDCEGKERNHPDFQKARDAEMEQVRQGNYNFPGIGKPEDL